MPEIDARRRSLEFNRGLIGLVGGRGRVDTPALLLDLDLFEKNLAAMASFAARTGVNLRPHGKTHKCPEIGRRQIEAGAVGLCCSKVSELETFAALNQPSLLLTAPVFDRRKIERIATVLPRIGDLLLAVDDLQLIDAYSTLAAETGRTVRILVDIDLGLNRTGVGSVEEALALASAVVAKPGLHLAGLQGYAGFLQHIESDAERSTGAAKANADMAIYRSAFRENGLDCRVISGSGTGTFDVDAEAGVFTELQVGSYIFMDADYNRLEHLNPHRPCFDVSLTIATQVVSRRHAAFATTDAGSKCIALDGRLPTVASGPLAGNAYRTSGDHFGRVSLADGQSVSLGQHIELINPHCDPTINLFGGLLCVRGQEVMDIWPVNGGAVF